MQRHPSDPLRFIPSADHLRRRVRESETLAERYRILLDVAERLEGAEPGDRPDRDDTPLLAGAATGGA